MNAARGLLGAGVALSLPLLLFLPPRGISAADWPRFRGAAADGIVRDTVRFYWPKNGLRVAWRYDAFGGYGSVAVCDGRAYAVVGSGTNLFNKREACVAFDAGDGKKIWSTLLGLAPTPDTPSTTPTVHNGRVYVYGSDQLLSCLGAERGDLLWQRNLVTDFRATKYGYGNSQSPWVEDGRVYVSIAAQTNCLLALNATNGGLIWKGHTNSLTYGSPVGVTVCGVRQIVFPDAYGLVAVAPEDGRLLWRHYQTRTFTRQGASPVFHGDIGLWFGDSGKQKAVAFRVVRTNHAFATETLWTKDLGDTYTTPVVHDRHVYINSSNLELECLELLSGTSKWRAPPFSGASFHSLVQAGDRILGLVWDGSLVEVLASPDIFLTLARNPALDSLGFLNSPAVANGRIFIRDPQQLICYDASPPSPLALAAVRLPDPLRFRLTVRRADGNPFAPEEVPQLNVFRSANLLLPLGRWTRATCNFSLNDGLLTSEVIVPQTSSIWFYRVE
jgi:outer membrane protein assembly factor BamB